MRNGRESANPRVLVVGSGPHFLSGISYYTYHLATALAAQTVTAAILMRRLIPVRLYPGRARVGKPLVDFDWTSLSEVYDGIDWFWIPSVIKATRLLRRQRPDLVVLQWWTGAVLHSLLLVAALARRRGAQVVIEFHEVQDIGELDVPLAGRYVRLVIPFLLRRANGYVVHSDFDRAALKDRYDLGDKPILMIPHAVYDAYREASLLPKEEPEDSAAGVMKLLYFGVIRPFKGVEDLVRAFDSLDETEIENYRLTVVGETWEGWTLPGTLIEQSRYRDRIEFVNHYIDDADVRRYFAEADVVVLPYHRSSSSGPLGIAMGSGKAVIVTEVGGLVDAAAAYGAAVQIPPQSPQAIIEAIRRLRRDQSSLVPARPFTFDMAAQAYLAFFNEMQAA